MSFLAKIMDGLRQHPDRPILLEVHGQEPRPTSRRELLDLIARARRALRAAGLQPGDRCVLLAPNSVRWVAVDLAIIAEKAIVVPLYARQAPAELRAMVKDSTPRLVLCATAELRDAVTAQACESPKTLLMDDLFPTSNLEASLGEVTPPEPSSSTPAAIIYTSGTSGDAKGVVLTHGNLSFMVARTSERLPDILRGVRKSGEDRIFHYLPFCFAGSWIMLLTCLYRAHPLMMGMDLTRLPDELRAAAPHYFLNVPALLERIRSGILTKLGEKNWFARWLFQRCQAAYLGLLIDLPSYPIRKRIWGVMGHRFLFPRIRRRVGKNLRRLLCGSAPLGVETQRFFDMIGLPVLQIYGLTETTAICTMDAPGQAAHGRVGSALEGTEMKLGEHNEIMVRGPHIFPGYWQRPEATAEILKDGWLHTGDQGEVDHNGNWKITGRIKSMIITTGGHNISPEPIEALLQEALPTASHVMVVGNDRKSLAAIVAGEVSDVQAQAGLERVNRDLPHYKQVRKFICVESFTEQDGLLTANRKLRRGAIEARFRAELDRVYQD